MKNQTTLTLATILALGLTACGDKEKFNDDTNNVVAALGMDWSQSKALISENCNRQCFARPVER